MLKPTPLDIFWPAILVQMALIWLFFFKLSGQSTLYAVILATFFFELVVLIIWKVFLYPYYFSPLRHLPMPRGGHWLWGHGMKLQNESQGNPSKEWYVVLRGQ